jgi:hypothetical protein
MSHMRGVVQPGYVVMAGRYLRRLKHHYHKVREKLHGGPWTRPTSAPNPIVHVVADEPPLNLRVQFTEDCSLSFSRRRRFTRSTFRGLVNSMAKKWGVDEKEIMARNRKKMPVRARNEVMYILRVVHHLSYPHIGRLLNMDHSSCYHGARKHARMSKLPMPHRGAYEN